jgi:hypothetical protein
MRSSMICTVLLTHYCAGDKIKKNEMGGQVAGAEEGRGVYRVLVGILRERTTGETQA